jgi:hypothetical protein
MTTHVLLLGRTPFDPLAVETEISVSGVELAYGTSLGDVEAAFSRGPVDVVIMGAGIPLADRLDIVEHVFASSDSTSVHMKDRASGPRGMMPFINQVLSGLGA